MTITRWLRQKVDDEIRAEGRSEGIAQGMAEGRSEGIAEGRSKGIAEGRSEGKIEMHRAWSEWYRRLKEAEGDGKPFDEPPPSL